MKNSSNYDVLVIGSGIGGLTTGALLAKAGKKVLVLEKNHLPGGCVSTYPRYGFRFEAGATTLMGFDRYQPMERLERELGLKLAKTKLEIPMTVWLDGTKITRYENLNDWIAEAENQFGSYAQRDFWELCYQVAADAWEISYSMPYFPPGNFSDWVNLAKPNNLRFLKSFPWLFKSTRDVLESFGLTRNKRFMSFINQQMLIASQAYSDSTQFLVGAPVLTYTNSPNYYLDGGLVQLPDQLIGLIRQYGGAIHYRQEVSHIRQNIDGFELTCTDGSVYHSEKVISNSTIWNMAEIVEKDQCGYFKKLSDRFQFGWGAFIVNLGIKDRFDELSSLHHQVIFDEPLPFLNSVSVFVSANDKRDQSRAPDGWRAVNISTHDPHPQIWFGLGDEAYEERKRLIEEAILDRIKIMLPLKESDIRIHFSATARSFDEWIGRKHGRVGGIPSDGLKTIFRMASPRTPMKNLYMVGDTTFPGQGISAVAQSGINTFLRIMGDT